MDQSHSILVIVFHVLVDWIVDGAEDTSNHPAQKRAEYVNRHSLSVHNIVISQGLVLSCYEIQVLDLLRVKNVLENRLNKTHSWIQASPSFCPNQHDHPVKSEGNWEGPQQRFIRMCVELDCHNDRDENGCTHSFHEENLSCKVCCCGIIIYFDFSKIVFLVIVLCNGVTLRKLC